MQSRLIKYLPEFLQEIQEFKTIMEVSESFIKNINEETDNSLKDMFILDATERGVEHYEKILNITPKLTEDLDSRKFRVYCKYNEKLPYTYNNLIKILNNICGEGYYKINISFEDLTLDLKIYLQRKTMFDSVEKILERVIPMNITINLSLLYNTWKSINTITWGSTSSFNWIKLREEIL